MHPSFAHFISKLLVERLAHSSHRHPSLEAPRSVALLPLSEGIPLTELAHGLCDALLRMGLRAQVLDTACARLDVEWHGGVGEANDVVIYQADAQANPWTRLCIRQSDHVLAVADASAPAPPVSARIGALLPHGHPGALELLVVHRDPSFGPPWLEDLIAGIGAAFHMHARLGNRADVDRLARLLTGRAVGVVLSGGAARGFAHLGVIQALREAGVPIDMVAGTSIGALIAAGVGLERDTMDEEMREAFVVRNPLSDYTLPIVSIFRGRRTSRLLREHGRGLRVGDCWRPYFCTSSNLSSGNVRVHRDGPLWRAVRASLAIPGVLPPVIDGGEVLVDGGVLNNLPADVMLAMRRGPVIAVDVCRKSGFSASAVDVDELPLWKMVSGKRRGVPNILALLVRAGTISSQAQVKALASRVDLLIEPKLDGVAMLDWHAFDRAVKAGYHQTVVQLQNEPQRDPAADLARSGSRVLMRSERRWRTMRAAKVVSALTAALALLAGAWEMESWWRVRGASADPRIQSQAEVVATPLSRVSALGRIEPQDGVIRIAAPTQLNVIDPVLGRLFIDDGSPVTQGQVVAILDDHDTLAAEVERLKADLDHVRLEEKRYEVLHRNAVVNDFDWDDWRFKDRIGTAQLRQAQAELALTTIRSPITGRVLKVHAREGERVGPQGIAEVGKTGAMCAIAEVYESDVRYVRVGDRATISSPALPAPLSGTVDRIGYKIGKEDVFAINPAARTDARVVEVRIRLDDSKAAADWTFLQVNVVIDAGILEAHRGPSP